MALIIGEMWDVETNIPSGYNFASNTLSPTGLSDALTFTRSTTGVRIKSDGMLENIAPNQPRFQHRPLTGAPQGILIEAVAANTLWWSEALDNAVWNAPSTNGVVTPNVGTDQFGLITFDRLASDGTNNRRRQTVAHTSGSLLWYNRIAVRKQTPAVTAELSIGIAGGTAVTTTVTMDTATGVATRTVGTGAFGVIEHRNHWILWASLTDNASGNTSRFSELRTVTSGTTVDFGAAQMESGSLTSYIKTEGATAQRTGDVLQKPFTINSGRITLIFDAITATVPQSGPQRLFEASTDNNNRFNIQRTSSGGIAAFSGVGSASVSSSTYPVADGQRTKIALTLEAGRMAMAITGNSVITIAIPAAPPVNTMWIGSLIGGIQQWNGTIASIQEYNGVAFTDDELLAAVAL